MATADRPIFLVGCARSGTTLLSAMLHAHPRIAIAPETRFLLPVYRDRQTFGDLRVPENRRRLARQMTRSKARFPDLGLGRRDVVAAIVAGPPTIGSAAGTIWREFARSRGKPRWGEKRPAYWRHMDVVLRLFPSAQVVHLVRDGRACVASLKQVPWWHSGTVGAMTSWVLADRELRRVGGRLPADSYYRLRYEDLLADPRGELSGLCEFLGEEFDAQMLDHATAARDIVPDRKDWHDRTKGELDVARIEAWREVLSPQELGLFEAVAGRALRRNGYAASGAGARPGPRALTHYELSRGYNAGLLHKERARDAWLRWRHPQPLSDLGGG